LIAVGSVDRALGGSKRRRGAAYVKEAAIRINTIVMTALMVHLIRNSRSLRVTLDVLDRIFGVTNHKRVSEEDVQVNGEIPPISFSPSSVG
jgi:hypothetical protein